MSAAELCIDRGGLVLHASAWGTGPPVLLLHAGGENRRVWSPIAERLAAQGYRAVAVDQRGHGQTGGPVAASLDEYAEDVKACASSLTNPVTLVGASLGGMASLLALADTAFAPSVRGLVLVDVVPDPDPEGVLRFLSGESGGPARDLGFFRLPLVADILGRAPQLRAATGRLSIPLTLVRAAHGPIRDADVARLLELAPHTDVRLVEGSSHLVARDRPAQLADALVEHVAAYAALERDRCG